VFREYSDLTVRAPGDVKALTNLTELGAIPNARLGRLRRAGSLTSSRSDDSDEIELITSRTGPSPIGDAFLSVVTTILNSRSGPRLNRHRRDQPQLMVVSSANAMEGKTTVASNLAIALSQTGRRVLLIDADLRSPRLHKIFNLANHAGLSSILGHYSEQGDNWKDYVVNTQYPGLQVLPSGPLSHNAARLFHSSQLAHFFARCRAEFDTILIDTPPSLYITDARVVGQFSDGVILVVRSASTAIGSITAIRDRFVEDGVPILGVVLNNWNPEMSPNGYYGDLSRDPSWLRYYTALNSEETVKDERRFV